MGRRDAAHVMTRWPRVNRPLGIQEREGEAEGGRWRGRGSDGCGSCGPIGRQHFVNKKWGTLGKRSWGNEGRASRKRTERWGGWNAAQGKSEAMGPAPSRPRPTGLLGVAAGRRSVVHGPPKSRGDLEKVSHATSGMQWNSGDIVSITRPMRSYPLPGPPEHSQG